MDKFKTGQVVGVIPKSEDNPYVTVLLKRNEDPNDPTKELFFAVREYRTKIHRVGDTPSIPITGEVENYVSPKTGKAVKCYTTEARLGSNKTGLSVDVKGNFTLASFSTLSPTDLLHLSVNALILKALAPTCTINQCVQSVVQLANDLRNQQ